MWDHASVISAAVLFSFYGILLKKTRTNVWLILSIKLILGFCIASIVGSVETKPWHKVDWEVFATLSLTYAYSVIALTLAFHRGSVAFVLPLFFTYPMIAVLFHVAKGLESITPQIIASGGACLAALLSLYFAERKVYASGYVDVTSFMLAISAAVAVGYRYSFLKDADVENFSANQKMWLQTGVGAVIAIIILMYTMFATTSSLTDFATDITDWLAYLPCTAWAIPVLLLFGMQTLPLLNVAAYAYVEVLIGLILSYILLRHEWPSTVVLYLRLLAAVFLGSAIFLTQL